MQGTSILELQFSMRYDIIHTSLHVRQAGVQHWQSDSPHEFLIHSCQPTIRHLLRRHVKRCAIILASVAAKRVRTDFGNEAVLSCAQRKRRETASSNM